MDALFNPLADALGASVDQIKLITCLLVSYPLGSVFIRLPSANDNHGHAAKHLFNIAVTLFFLIGMFNMWSALVQLLASILATYYIAKKAHGKNMPWIVFWVVMGHLTVNHVIRVLFNLSYETIEITGPQMVLTMKLTTFAWNVFDGRRPVEDLDKWQLEKRVVEYPSLVEFIGYCFYFPGFLVGPYLDFTSYRALVDESLFLTRKGKEKEAVVVSKRRIPNGRKRVAYRKMLLGLVYLGIFVTQGGKFNFGGSLQDWFAQKSLWYRILYIQLCGFIERTKYYAVWTLTEGASILTGCGFSGYGSNGESLWNDAANVNVLNIELAPNFKVMLDSWNMKTNVWLRECVYKRVTPKGKKPGFRSTMLTFATSAFWHGIAGGYYLAFFFGGFVQTAGRLCRAGFRPLLLPLPPCPRPNASKNSDDDAAAAAATVAATPHKRKIIYDALGTILAVMMMNYAAMPFMLLGMRESITGWRRVGGYGHIVVACALVFFYGGGSRYLKAIQAKRMGKTEEEVKPPSPPLQMDEADKSGLNT